MEERLLIPMVSNLLLSCKNSHLPFLVYEVLLVNRKDVDLILSCASYVIDIHKYLAEHSLPYLSLIQSICFHPNALLMRSDRRIPSFLQGILQVIELHDLIESSVQLLQLVHRVYPILDQCIHQK